MKHQALCCHCGQSFVGGYGSVCSLSCLNQHQNRIALAQFRSKAMPGYSPPRSAPDPVVQVLIDYAPQLLSMVHLDRNGNSDAANKITQLVITLRKQSRNKTC